MTGPQLYWLSKPERLYDPQRFGELGFDLDVKRRQYGEGSVFYDTYFDQRTDYKPDQPKISDSANRKTPDLQGSWESAEVYNCQFTFDMGESIFCKQTRSHLDLVTFLFKIPVFRRLWNALEMTWIN